LSQFVCTTTPSDINRPCSICENLAGKVRQRAISERESGGIEHRDLIAGNDERRAPAALAVAPASAC
jgi:hypothetical protein